MHQFIVKQIVKSWPKRVEDLRGFLRKIFFTLFQKLNWKQYCHQQTKISAGVIWGVFQVRYDSRVVIYERKLFIRLATDLRPIKHFRENRISWNGIQNGTL